jgi:pimeloyl-ACP methyl ester carboxylesterase
MAAAPKTPLVLVPGLLCTAELYADQRSSLADVADMTVGCHTRHETMAEIARAILAEAPPRFALAGLSMGGYVTFEILRQAPERVLKLALLDTAARPDAPERKEARLKLIELGRTHGMAAVQNALMGNLIHAGRQNDQPLVDRVVQMAVDTGFEAFVRQQKALMNRPDSRDFLRQIEVPTLVVVGDADVLTPPDLSREMHAGIAGSRLEVIAGSGHLSTMEMPHAVNAALRQWLTA